jgi:hypothetical protein
MYTILHRLNGVVAFGFSSLATVTFCCFLTGFLYTSMPQVEIEIRDLYL